LVKEKTWRKKLLREIKRISSKERRKINDILHKISREIVDRTKEIGATIVIGDLKGIREDNGRNESKVLNRIVNRMPYRKLMNIEYKAMLDSVPIVKVKEYYTSKICHKCNNLGERKNSRIIYLQQL
jgi:putative transposase